MGWITPVAWPIPAPVGNADLDRIEGDLNYLREETATFNGVKTFTENINFGTGSGGGTPRNTIKYALGGFGVPGAWNTNSNGDKITVWDNGVDTDTRIGMSTTDSLWVKAMGTSIPNAFSIHGSLLSSGSPNRLFTVTKTGRTIISSVDNTTDFLQINTGENMTSTIGLGTFGYNGTEGFTLAHSSNFNTTDYLITQDLAGSGAVNSKLGQDFRIKNSGADLAIFADGGTTIYENITHGAVDTGSDVIRNTFRFTRNGFGAPGAWNTDSQGDKFNFWSDGTSTENRIGMSLTDSLWVKAMGATIPNAFSIHGSLLSSGSPNRLFTVTKTGDVVISGAINPTTTTTIGASTTITAAGALTATTINTGYGDNDVVPEEVFRDRLDDLGTHTLQSLNLKGTNHRAFFASGGSLTINLPATGVYAYTVVLLGISPQTFSENSITNITVVTIPQGYYALITHKRVA